jgi:tetratricopeptide (TPR) repeat protein
MENEELYGGHRDPDYNPEREREANERVMQAKAIFDARNFDAALEMLDDIIENYPESAFAWSCRGIVKGTMRRFLDSIDDFTQAIELQPDYTEAYLNRYQTYFNFKRFEDAIADLNMVNNLAPGQPNIYFLIGNCYIELRRNKQAIPFFDKAIELFPDYALAYLNRAAAKFNSMDTSACDDWAKAYELGLLEAEEYLEKFCQ